MASEGECFDLSGPLHLISINWSDVGHRRSVAACLVQSVYILERDRQEKRTFAPPWWEFFEFQLHRELIDDADQSIFGAIYEFKPKSKPENNLSPSESPPRYVIAFRGTITKGDAFTRDLELDIHFIRNELHKASRVEIALRAVKYVVDTFDRSNVWVTGHSLGSAIAMHVGKSMAKTSVFLDTFLFNPPFVSAPIENLQDKKLKQGIRIASSFLTAGFAVALKNSVAKNRGVGPVGTVGPTIDTFEALSAWVPSLFVNGADHICSEYIGYFEHRKNMEAFGVGGIERLATQHSLGGLLMNAFGKESEEPLHLIPSANLVVNLSRAQDFKDAHGIHQWWRKDSQLQSTIYQFK